MIQFPLTEWTDVAGRRSPVAASWWRNLSLEVGPQIDCGRLDGILEGYGGRFAIMPSGDACVEFADERQAVLFMLRWA